VLLAPLILQITAPGFEGPTMELTVTLVRIIFPGVGLLVIAAWCQGVLNTHRRFFLSYVAPVLWNASMIATLVIFGTRLREADLAVALAWGTAIGCALQLAIQLPIAIRLATRLKLGFDRQLPEVREIFRNIAPVIGGRGVVQISGYIDQLIATLLPIGSVANLAYAQTIYMMPISLFGMSVAAAELPEMSRHTGTDEEIAAALRQRLARGLRQIAFFVVPTVVAFIAIGRILVAALFQTGKFGPELTRLVWYILVGSTIGLLVATLGRLYSSAFYALRDTRTPFRFALARVIVGAGLGAALAFPLRPLILSTIEALGGQVPNLPGGPAIVGVIGITAASGLAAWVEFLLLRRGLHRRIGKIEIPASFHVRLWTAALIAGVAAVTFDHFVARPVALRLPLPYISEAIAVAGVFALVYFAATMVVGVPESRATIGRFIRR
jgi:putative peptidoglycan lipid II flippase